MENVRIQDQRATDRTVIVLTTWPVDRDPDEVARRLIEQHLAACVNVMPVMQSQYWWQSAVQRDDERQFVIKTSAHRLPQLHATIQALHPYEVPEFLVIEVAAGADSYLEWVRTAAQG